MFATIQPVSVYPGTATVLYINNVNVHPGASATLQAWLQDDKRQNLTQSGVEMVGDAYAAWGNDDAYLYTYTAAQLGLTIVEIVPDAPPAPPVAEPAPVVEPVKPVVEPVKPSPVDAPAPVVAPSDAAAPAVDGGTQ